MFCSDEEVSAFLKDPENGLSTASCIFPMGRYWFENHAYVVSLELAGTGCPEEEVRPEDPREEDREHSHPSTCWARGT